MYRRIELIFDKPYIECKADYHHYDFNDDNICTCAPHMMGLMGGGPIEVTDAWIYDLNGPWGKRSHRIPRNAKFYFTELGWDKIGRKVIAAAIKTKQTYRVIAIKHNQLNVVWRDAHTGYEVAGQVRKGS